MKKISEYNSLSEAGRLNNTRQDAILKCCRKKLKTAGGYIWRYKEE